MAGRAFKRGHSGMGYYLEARYTPAHKYDGHRQGMIFKKDFNGVGYYPDAPTKILIHQALFGEADPGETIKIQLS